MKTTARAIVIVLLAGLTAAAQSKPDEDAIRKVLVHLGLCSAGDSAARTVRSHSQSKRLSIEVRITRVSIRTVQYVSRVREEN